MRNLFILRGAPASGKSTWIEENNLEPYTLSADKIRLLYQSPVTTKTGELAISQENDGEVWGLLFQLLETRMEKGEFVVVDATHYKAPLISRYKDLVDKYRYRVHVVDFSNVSEEELIRRNAKRDQYKKVPEDVIRKMVVALADSGEVKKSFKIITPEEASKMLREPLQPVRVDSSKIVVFGDIHGCFNPLQEYFKNNEFQDDYCYIFTGDYLDRGLQNKEVLEFLMELSKKPNVFFIEGNHEKWLKMYASGDYSSVEGTKISEYKDLQAHKIVHELKFIISNLQKKIRDNKRQMEDLSALLKQSWEENPGNEDVYYRFELVNVPSKQRELVKENEHLEHQIQKLERRITRLKHEVYSTELMVADIKEATAEFGGVSLNTLSLLKKEYNLEQVGNKDVIKSREFLKNTLPQIKEIEKAQIRQFCRKLIQMSYFEFGGTRFFACHGGLPSLPTIFTPTKEMISGVGAYEDHASIEEQFNRNTFYEVVQIHGHRNVTRENPVTPLLPQGYSVNLEGDVENGGHLRIIEISKNGESFTIKPIEIKNDYFRSEPEEVTQEVSDQEVLKKMYESKWIQVKNLNDNIVSFNFSREAFEKDKWNKRTCHARGLFIDGTNGNVVARSFDKFFNYKQTTETKPESMKANIKWPLIGYKKENGYLGILSKYNGKIRFFTKSSDSGDYVNWFIGALCENYGITGPRGIEYSDVYNELGTFESAELKEAGQHLLDSCKAELIEKLGSSIQEGYSYVFEVIDPKNDPHIIQYSAPKVVLLEVFKNQLTEECLPYMELKKVAEGLSVAVKSQDLKFNDWETFEKWKSDFREGSTQWNCKHEGYVFEDANGFRVKFKSSFYNFWKAMRAVKDKIAGGREYKKIYKTKEEIQVVKLLEEYTREELKEMSIIDIANKFYSRYEEPVATK